MGNRTGMSCLEKRQWLNRPAVAVDELTARGRALEEAGWIHDAVDFYEKAKAHGKLERLVSLAVEEGDAFLFLRLHRLLQKEPSAEQWKKLAQRAEALGKNLYAQRALQHLS